MLLNNIYTHHDHLSYSHVDTSTPTSTVCCFMIQVDYHLQDLLYKYQSTLSSAREPHNRSSLRNCSPSSYPCSSTSDPVCFVSILMRYYSHQMIQRGGSVQKITSGLNAEQTLSAIWFWLCAEGLSPRMFCRWPSDFTRCTRSENQTVSVSKRSSVGRKLNLSGTAKHHCKWTITVSEPSL